MLLDKAEKFVNVAGDMYGALVDGVYDRGKFTKRIRELEIDSFDDVRAKLMRDMLRDIHALNRHRHLDRPWKRLRERIERKSDQFKEICEKEAKGNVDGTLR